MTNALLNSYQYLIPQHLLSKSMGRLANARTPWLKNFLIDTFIKLYGVDMANAVIENPHDYPTFNSFFIRHLKSKLRPISTEPNVILSPVDGSVSQIGYIQKNQLLQAKQHYYDLETLLGKGTLAKDFYEGAFATFYLAPHNYHRVHMPLTGQLVEAIYIPGTLFSVNSTNNEHIPRLYTRNERLVTIFNTQAGPLAVILVAALIVGGIKTTWMEQEVRSRQIENMPVPKDFKLLAGEELGYFSMGSTVILLLAKDKAQWLSKLATKQAVNYGEVIGNISRLG